MIWWRIQSAWKITWTGNSSTQNSSETWPAQGAVWESGSRLCFRFCFEIYFLLGQFSGSPFQIIPATFWPISQCFTLDEGICLWGKGLRCPGGGGEGVVVSVLLPVCHSVISANRPEEPSPAGPREEAEDFRATDSGVMIQFHLTDLATTNMHVLIRHEINSCSLVLCQHFVSSSCLFSTLYT